MTWLDFVRYGNIIACAFALWLLATAAYRQWKTWNQKTETHWWSLFGWVFLGLEASIENIIIGSEPGPRSVIQALVVAWTIRALTMREELHAGPTIPWKEEPDE